MKPLFHQRALTLSRVGFALILLLSLLEWSLDFNVLLAPTGFLPLEALVDETRSGRFGWSLYNALPGRWPALALFLSTFLGAIALGAGWRPRTAVLWTFLTTLSLHNRCALALEPADAALLLGLFALLGVCRKEAPSWIVSWFLMLMSLAVWSVDMVVRWEHLSPLLRVGGVVAPLLLIGCRNAYQRNGALALSVVLFGLIHWGEWRLLAAFCCWAVGWLWLERVPDSVSDEPSNRVAPAGLALVFVLFLVAPTDSARFWALGPRAQAISREVWFVPIGVNPKGERWDLDSGKEPTFEWRGDRFIGQSHRRRLFLGTMARAQDPDLPYWVALSLLRRERSEGQKEAVRVQLYRCRQEETPQLVGEWPLQRY